MDPEPDLSVVIPVHDAADHVAAVIEEVLSIPDITVQVVAVDDRSSDSSGEILDEIESTNPNVLSLKHTANRGAGVARNTGFAAATGRYTLFFDADDLLVPATVARVVSHMDDCNASMAMMPYRYRRGTEVVHEAMNHFDVQVWHEVMAGQPHRITRLREVPQVLGFSNYPWNKILKTDHYRRVGLRFGETPVHNDILGHWHSLLFADRILLADEVICTHIVELQGKNLSNRHHRERLSLFDALDTTYDLLKANPHLRGRYSHHYWSFVIRIAGWAGSRISDDLREEFNARLQDHLLRIDLTDFVHIRTHRNPRLADAIIQRSLI